MRASVLRRRTALPWSTSCLSTVRTSRQTPEDVADMPTYDYTAASDRRRIYVWGFARCGALGIPSYVKPEGRRLPLREQHRPARLQFVDQLLESVVDVACGYGFTVFAVNTKRADKVFGTGLNGDSQIGYHSPRRGVSLDRLIQPAPIALPIATPERTKVRQVACGRAHTAVLTDNDGVFTLGNNAYGQCARPVVDDEDYKGNPRVFRAHLPHRVDQVVCSQDNTYFIMASGQVFACGWNADGQLGNGQYDNGWEPTPVSGDIEGEKILQLSSTADCVLALSDKGDVFGWGNSEYGQLSSVTTCQQVSRSCHLPLRDCGRIVQVAASGSMCAVINSDGEVYVWGYGLLGKGPALQQSPRPTPIPSTLFGRNQFNPDVKVAKLCCGLNHFVAVTNEGDVYSWGRNKMSCLGLGHAKDQYFPLRVAVPARTFKVSCGVDHTAALCRALN